MRHPVFAPFLHCLTIIMLLNPVHGPRRIDVGGKLLTNHLKELVSFRQWNMMDETYVMNEVKETCCYVSREFGVDLETCRYVFFSIDSASSLYFLPFPGHQTFHSFYAIAHFICVGPGMCL